MLFTTLSTVAFAVLATAIPTNPISTLSARQESNTTTPFCYQKSPGIYSPASGAIITQNTSTYDCTNITILYCSGQYFKTSSIDTSVGLSQIYAGGPGIASGQLLAKDVKPDNADAQAGYASYRYNVTLCPGGGDYLEGEYALSVYETETGYYNPMNYNVYSVNITLATSDA
ncbi:hypothetical protein MBLNU457_g0569t1 [Dothideomycetes sp. NU457]